MLKKIDEFPEKVESDKDYKIGIPQEKSFKTKKKVGFFHLQVYHRAKLIKEEVKEVNHIGYENGKKNSENEDLNRYLHNLYYDLTSPVSFSGFYKLYYKI